MTAALTVELRGRVGRLDLDVALTATARGLLLAGENGAGKTSVLRYVLGAQRPEVGRIELGARTLLDTRAGVDLPLEARRLGWVPQHQGLFPHLTAVENVAFGIRSARGTDAPRERLTRAERLARAEALLARLDAGQLAKRRPGELSGGERQRVALARALAPEPEALLLDEPFAAIDARARTELRTTLAATLAAAGVPYVLVAHDVRDAEGLTESIAVMEAGRVVAAGSLEGLRAAPPSPFVAELLAARR